MEKNSFVFHFEYLHDIPEELRGQWALFIIDYAETGIEPALTSWMESKLWNSIKSRIDSECQKYQSKVANLKQNSKKNLHSIEKRFSETENLKSDTENELSETENLKSVSDNRFSETENDFSVGVYVFDSVSVSDSVNESVNVSESEFGSGYVEPSPQKKKTEKKQKKKTEPIEKPTLDEVVSFCKEKNFTFSPEKFWKYYEDNSWGVRFYNENGKCIRFVPVKDWKQKAEEWQERQTEFKSSKTSPPISNNQNVDEFENYFLKDKADGEHEETKQFPDF
ncbi:MAG: DUF6291 domain-containing protein [Treponema sp.]|nr:DUF6291 domain-containing protein [Treponema sp.]